VAGHLEIRVMFSTASYGSCELALHGLISLVDIRLTKPVIGTFKNG
jgi:hypothetical protein